MNGNTPRSVSLWGALGSMSLAVLLLPLNASWAQKADEPKEFEVVVKALGEPDDATERAAANKGRAEQLVRGVIAAFPETQPEFQVRTEVLQLDAKSPETVIVRVNGQEADKSDDGKTSIHLELKADGSTFVIEADSIPEALKKLKDQIDALFSKTPLSAEDKKRARILERALKALGETAKQIDETKSKDVKRYRPRTIKVDEPGAAKQSEDKKAAERDAIRKRVEALSQDVREKRVELAAAQKRLSELDRESDRKPSKPVAITKPVYIVNPTRHQIEVQIDADKSPTKNQELTITTNHPTSDQKRIDALEKTLQKLLDEVASLKKEKSDAKK